MGEQEKREFETWEEVIVDFFENNIQNSNLYKARKYINEKDKKIDSEMDINKKNKLIQDRNKKIVELDELRTKAPSGEIRDWIVKITDSDNKKAPIKESHKVSKATHILKFTHSSSKAESLLITEKSGDKLLSTSSIKKKIKADFAHNDGALISISRFLALELSGESIFDSIVENDFSFFDDIAKNVEELNNWKKVFTNLTKQQEIKSADKAKQIYFPLTNEVLLDDSGKIDNDNYHLLIPLFSSSIAEEIYVLQRDLKYGEEQKAVRQAKKGKALFSYYHPKSLIEFPNLAIQKFGGEYPRNVSMLNADRGGISYVFSAEPPVWQSQLRPPVNKESLFHHRFTLPGTKDDINYLREFLLRFKLIGLSIKNPDRWKWVEKWVLGIIDNLLNYITSIQKLPEGWSSQEDVRLKQEHQYLLDPFRNDADFQAARKASDWQTVVCNDFARWLNFKLRGREKKFTPQPEHRRMWVNLLEPQLRRHNELIESERKRRGLNI